MDYLPYRWTNHGITISYHFIRVDLALYEIFYANVCDFCSGLYKYKINSDSERRSSGGMHQRNKMAGSG